MNDDPVEPAPYESDSALAALRQGLARLQAKQCDGNANFDELASLLSKLGTEADVDRSSIWAAIESELSLKPEQSDD